MKITLGKMCDGNLSIGDDREADIFANGQDVGTLTVSANRQTECGLTSSGDRYSASSVTALVWPHGIAGDPVERTFEMYHRGPRGWVKVLTTAQAKKAARAWVAEALTAARAAK